LPSELILSQNPVKAEIVAFWRRLDTLRRLCLGKSAAQLSRKR
jgi:hypothetical protein